MHDKIYYTNAKAELAKCDVLIMTGGEDIDPSYYGQEPDPNLEDVNKDRDVSDMAMLQEAIEEDMPVLCTCRGAQLLNVVCGGTLIQDIPTSVAYKNSDILHRSDGSGGLKKMWRHLPELVN